MSKAKSDSHTLSLFDDVGKLICGVDEAGRGPLAGPVFAAAVILDPAKPIDGLRDSKKLTEAKRDMLALQIKSDALAWSIAQCSEAEIDALNILQATMLAMRRAIEGLHIAPTLALIDGNRCPIMSIRSEAIVKGARHFRCIDSGKNSTRCCACDPASAIPALCVRSAQRLSDCIAYRAFANAWCITSASSVLCACARTVKRR